MEKMSLAPRPLERFGFADLRANHGTVESLTGFDGRVGPLLPFHPLGRQADVAQRQSKGLISPWPVVRFHPSAPTLPTPLQLPEFTR